VTYKSIAILGLGCALLAGCGSGDRVRDVYRERQAEQQVEAGELAPGEVFTAAKALNQAELDVIGPVKARLEDPELKTFADMVERDHRDALVELERVGDEMEGLTPFEGELTREIQKDAYETAESLDDARGDDVDEQFLKAMIDTHRNALSIIDRRLLPSATGELLEVISGMRQHVTHHLSEANRLRDARSK
jgi:predicted outer membrane protein